VRGMDEMGRESGSEQTANPWDNLILRSAVTNGREVAVNVRRTNQHECN
jgi:hypothetical protein